MTQPLTPEQQTLAIEQAKLIKSQSRSFEMIDKLTQELDTTKLMAQGASDVLGQIIKAIGYSGNPQIAPVLAKIQELVALDMKVKTETARLNAEADKKKLEIVKNKDKKKDKK